MSDSESARFAERGLAATLDDIAQQIVATVAQPLDRADTANVIRRDATQRNRRLR